MFERADKIMTCHEINKKIINNGLRHDYLASYLGISNSYFTMMLSGKRIMDRNKINKLSEILSIYEAARNIIKYGR